jgi:hypothetical protein
MDGSGKLLFGFGAVMLVAAFMPSQARDLVLATMKGAIQGFTESATSTPGRNEDRCSGAETHWKSAEAIGTRAALEDHIVRFPSCSFAGLAKARIAAIATSATQQVLIEGGFRVEDNNVARSADAVDLSATFIGQVLRDGQTLWQYRTERGVVNMTVPRRNEADKIRYLANGKMTWAIVPQISQADSVPGTPGGGYIPGAPRNSNECIARGGTDTGQGCRGYK